MSDDRDDTASLLSSDDRSGQRRHVKYVHTINKLQSELAMMEEKLKKVNATDVTLLLQHLRENKIDIRNLQTRNGELKERISVLELQLLEAHCKMKLLVNADVDEVSSSPYAYNIEAISLEEKCNKMEIIIGSYNDKIQKLQDKIAELEKVHKESFPKSQHKEHDMYNGTNGNHIKTEKRSQSDVERAVAEARAVDKATLHQLSLEIERLTSLLDVKDNDLLECEKRETKLRREVQQLATSNKIPEVIPVQNKQEQVHLLYSFLYGVVFMMVCNVLMSLTKEWFNSSEKGAVQGDVD